MKLIFSSCWVALTCALAAPSAFAHGPSSLGDIVISLPFMAAQKLSDADLTGVCSGEKTPVPSVDNQAWFYAGDPGYKPLSVVYAAGKTTFKMPERPDRLVAGGYGTISALASTTSSQVTVFESFWRKSGENTVELSGIADKYDISATPSRRGCVYRGPHLGN